MTTTAAEKDRRAKSAGGLQDLMLALVSYPDAPPAVAAANGARLARRLGGEVTALVLAIRIKAPRNRLADALIDFKTIVKEELARSEANARSVARAFEDAAERLGAPAVARIETVDLYEEAERFSQRARTRDLTLIPIGPVVKPDRSIAEAVLFGSGRPVLLFPESVPLDEAARFETVAVAWDGSRQAARALADALPVLVSAGRVRVLTVLNEKRGVDAGAGGDVIRHLRLHGVKAVADEVDAEGRSIAEVLDAYVGAHVVDLLVMGGFARSRARELILGGATRAVLENLTVPVLMAH